MKYIIIFLFASILNVENVYPQGCCTVGSSTFGGLERGITNKDNINIGISFIRNGLNTTYNEKNEIKDPLGRSASVSVFNFELEYGISDKVSILVIGGYSIKERETVIRSSVNNTSEKIVFNGNGFTDMTFIGKYEIITPSIISALSLSLGGGAKIPVGNYNLREDGTRLSIDLQPGTGATDVIVWGNFYKGFLPLSFSLIANLLYRYPSVNLDGYRFGDEYIFSLIGEYYFTEYLTLSVGMRARFAEEDFWNGRFLPSTGGTYYDVIPGVIYSERAYSLKIFYQSPVYRNVRGIQLTTSNIIGAEILFSFDI